MRREAFEIPMWTEGRHLVDLAEVLARVDLPPLAWRLSRFWAMARPDSGLDILALEREVEAAGELGLELSDERLRDLAARLDQVIDCDLFGFQLTTVDRVLDQAVVFIEAFDSNTWRVEIDEGEIPIPPKSGLGRA